MAKEYNFFYLPVARALKQTRIMRERLMPRMGEVLVKRDDRVEPVDIVARVPMPNIIRSYNLAKMFKLSPAQVKKILTKKKGDKFAKREVLARHKPLLGQARAMRAPSDGRIIDEHNGEVLISEAANPLELQANIKGTIANVMPRFGVMIQTAGGLVQGVWGNGKEVYGVCKLLSDNREQSLSAELIDVSCLGAIVTIGGALTAEGLKQAEAQKVGGIVAGSVPAALRQAVLAVSFPVMITEGFGALLMAEPAFELLKTYNTREANLRAVVQTRWGATRPELVIPLTSRESANVNEIAAPVVALENDVPVRICAGEYQGHVGHVVSAKPQSRTLTSGVRTRAVEVEIEYEERVWVPINNLEAIA
jgi:hypothetical protein